MMARRSKKVFRAIRRFLRHGIAQNGIFPFFLVFTLLLGGAGVHYPLLGSLIEIFAIFMLYGALAHYRWQDASVLERLVLVLAFSACSLLLLQLIPLPWSWWTSLPGRATAANIYRVAGMEGQWHAFSLTPDSTLQALFALTTPIAAFFTTLDLSTNRRLAAMRIVVFFAAATALLGIWQISSGAHSPLYPFATSHRGLGVGLFVNRNHQALFLDIALLFTVVPGVIRPSESRSGQSRSRQSQAGQSRSGQSHSSRQSGTGGVRGGGWPMVVAFAAILSLGVLATMSRFGLALLVVSGVSSLAIALDWRRYPKLAIIFFVAIAITAAIVFFSPLGVALLDRFSTAADDMRFSFWRNMPPVIFAVAPLGAGFGSFTTLYPTIEPLGQVNPDYVNHAHNEYLELALDGGIPALALIAGAILLLAFVFRTGFAWPRRSAHRSMTLAACVAIGLVLLHSIVDYPFRMDTITLLVGLCAALPFRGGAGSTEKKTRGPLFRSAAGRYGAAILSAITAGLVAATAWGQYAMLARLPGIAVTVAPWIADGWTEYGEFRFLAQDRAAAAAAARSALTIRPMNAEAVRMLAEAALGWNDLTGAKRLLQTGAPLGWRESVTQFLLASEAMQRKDAERAALHLDAIMRLQPYNMNPVMMQAFHALVMLPGGIEALTRRLVFNPPWRQSYLKSFGQDPDATPEEFNAILAGLRRAGSPATSDEAAAVLYGLAHNGDFANLHHVHDVSQDNSLLFDSGFDEPAGPLPHNYQPYRWQSRFVPGVTAAVITPDVPWNGQALQIASSGIARGIAIYQLFALATGTYHFSTMVRRDQGMSNQGGEWQFVCRQQNQSSDAIPLALAWTRQRDGWWRGEGTIEVTSSCPGQMLTFYLTESSGHAFNYSLDDVSLTDLRTAPDGRNKGR